MGFLPPLTLIDVQQFRTNRDRWLADSAPARSIAGAAQDHLDAVNRSLVWQQIGVAALFVNFWTLVIALVATSRDVQVLPDAGNAVQSAILFGVGQMQRLSDLLAHYFVALGPISIPALGLTFLGFYLTMRHLFKNAHIAKRDKLCSDLDTAATRIFNQHRDEVRKHSALVSGQGDTLSERVESGVSNAQLAFKAYGALTAAKATYALYFDFAAKQYRLVKAVFAGVAVCISGYFTLLMLTIFEISVLGQSVVYTLAFAMTVLWVLLFDEGRCPDANERGTMKEFDRIIAMAETDHGSHHRSLLEERWSRMTRR
jgi:hypothetical protein